MRHKLFTVEDNFYLSGIGGTVVVGQLESEFPSFKPGDEVILIQPGGKEISSTITGIGMLSFRNLEARLKSRNKISMLFKTLTKKHIPVGTEVYLKAAE